MTDLPPDFCEPILGFRAWKLDDDGSLRAWAADVPWVPGPNRAYCVTEPSHAAPVSHCMCGLYALADVHDPRLHSGVDVIGAVAAWGEIELHTTGLRAEWMCVLALASPALSDCPLWAVAAAERYAVPLVDHEDLFDAGLASARPVSSCEPPSRPRRPARRGRRAPPLPADDAAVGDIGFAIDDHVWVHTAPAGVRIGITSAFANRLQTFDFMPSLPSAGRLVARGDTLCALGGVSAGTLLVRSPLGGVVIETNPRLASEPGALLSDAQDGGWLLRFAPTDWDEAEHLVWGADAEWVYRSVAQDASWDAFDSLTIERICAAPPVSSWGDLKHVLIAQRSRACFATASELRSTLYEAVRARVMNSEVVRNLGRMDRQVIFETSRPDARFRVDARPGAVTCCWDGQPEADAVVLGCGAEELHDLLSGRLDLASALRSRHIRSSLPVPETLRALALLKYLRIKRLPPAKPWEVQVAAPFDPSDLLRE